MKFASQNDIDLIAELDRRRSGSSAPPAPALRTLHRIRAILWDAPPTMRQIDTNIASDIDETWQRLLAINANITSVYCDVYAAIDADRRKQAEDKLMRTLLEQDSPFGRTIIRSLAQSLGFEVE